MELDFLAWLLRELPPHPCLKVGPGDDAAVLELGASPACVVTTDLLTDGVHFELGKVDPRRIGHKALAVNLSDLAAMAARPLAAVVAISVPRRGGLQLAKDLYAGLLPLAARYQVAIAGGDTNSWDGPLVISITAIGQLTPRGPLLRSGARPKDRILVTGSLGGSLLERHLDVEPRIDEALSLHERYDLHAGIDISDGLSLDLWRVAQASGCGAVLDLSAIPVSDAACRLAALRDDGRTPLDHALGDGEDFELLLAAEPDEAQRIVADQPLKIPIRDIGEFIAEPGLFGRGEGIPLHPLKPQGFEH